MSSNVVIFSHLRTRNVLKTNKTPARHFENVVICRQTSSSGLVAGANAAAIRPILGANATMIAPRRRHANPPTPAA